MAAVGGVQESSGQIAGFEGWTEEMIDELVMPLIIPRALDWQSKGASLDDPSA